MLLKSLQKALAATAIAFCVAAAPDAYAQKSRNTSRPAKASSLEATKRVKYKDKTSVDFDEAAIDGSVKNPFGSIVNSRDQDFDKGFIKLRYHWHDQMVMSLSGLSGN
jgi:hypothetical protein